MFAAISYMQGENNAIAELVGPFDNYIEFERLDHSALERLRSQGVRVV